MDGLRTEHTIGSFIAPHDAETASLTDPQIGQIFWNMAMTEAMVLAMLFDSEGDGPVSITIIITLAFISAGICISVGLLCRFVFMWGNRGRQRGVTDLRLDGPGKKGLSTSDPVVLLASATAAAAIAATTTTTDAATAPLAAANDAADSIAAAIATGGEKSAHHSFRADCAARFHQSRTSCRRWWRAGTAFRGSLRRKFSWAFNFFVFFMLSWMVITYAMQFGEEKTREWLLSWVVASAHAWLIIEPFEVIILALFPTLLENECVGNMRETAKELGLY